MSLDKLLFNSNGLSPISFDSSRESNKMRKFHHSFFYLLAGIVIGFISNLLLFNEPSESKSFIYSPNRVRHMNSLNKFGKIKKIRILCLINTQPKKHHKAAIHIQQTWGRNCDKLLFASTITDVSLNSIGFNMTDKHGYVWGKEKLMFQYVYKNFFDRYDWFFKADDDTFAIIENLRFMLSAYNTEDPIYFGLKLNRSSFRWGYFQGGAGYAISKRALKIFVEDILTDEKKCPQIAEDRLSEDMSTSFCWAKMNVYAGDSRDILKKERFLMDPPELYLLNKLPKWYMETRYYRNKLGLDGCSNYTISSHYLRPRYIYTLYFIEYHLKPYGIEYRYPQHPKKFNWRNMVRSLELERISSKYRN